MSTAHQPQKDENPLGGGLSGATTTKHIEDHNAEKEMATIRAKLSIAGGFILHRTLKDDGRTAFLVVSPWGQVREFASLGDIATAFQRWPA